jgi:putative transposase
VLEIWEWQNRPLDTVYPVIFFDALRVKIRDAGLVRGTAVSVARSAPLSGPRKQSYPRARLGFLH